MLLIHCLVCFPLVLGTLCLSLFCWALLCVLSSFAIILKRKRELVALLLLSYRCLVTVNDLWILLTVPLVGLHCVIVVFPDHTNFRFGFLSKGIKSKWVWIGNTTITNYRSTHVTARKSHRTITIMRHQEDKQSKATSALFPIKRIA